MALVVAVGGTHYAGNHFQQEACVNADGVPAEASYANVSRAPTLHSEECRWLGAGNALGKKKALAAGGSRAQEANTACSLSPRSRAPSAARLREVTSCFQRGCIRPPTPPHTHISTTPDFTAG